MLDAIRKASWYVHVYRVFWALAVLLFVAWWLWIRPAIAGGKQVRNWAIIQGYVAFLEAYREAHGEYPSTLEESVPAEVNDRQRWLAALDNYGRRLHFRSDGHDFTLASYGQDGVLDKDPMGLNDPELAPSDRVCKDADVDTQYSSRGNSQLCGK